MLKRLIGKAAVWAGLRLRVASTARGEGDPALERDIAASLTDETLAWALGTWRTRYL